ncbi:hypothetical protein L6164_029215 [Bauhinia variegata]|uniref:Uncharacterized protein n=1 Tax=Bauhinia variegata TaxID=167791 RepID=A0ACB9L8F1_BAUVA|nr:hypothetical protein L6164_029215 [Bauhinia variegata]
MDQILRLFDAARRGDVPELQQLLNIDPQILERVVSSTIYTETPLHVAALADQTDFARALITRMPSLTMEKNQEGLIPLHIASARGHLNMVRELLRHDSNHEQCLVKGRGGRIPLHDAVIKGRDSVIEDLISHFAESLTEVTERGETVLHLAAMNYQSRALEVLIERMKRLENFSAIFNAKDKGGNTFWDLGHHRQTRENDNEESGKNSGLQNAMQIVAGLILTATYQACVSPPSTIWKEGRKLDLRCMFKGNLDMELPLNTCPAASFYWFMLFNTAGFVSAFIIIILPISPGRKIPHVVPSTRGATKPEPSLKAYGPTHNLERAAQHGATIKLLHGAIQSLVPPS